MKNSILIIAWFLIILGGIIECFWVSGLKYSTEIWQYILTAIGVCISFTCFLKACERLEVSITYSVFRHWHYWGGFK
ncbi:hypothetical protein THJ066_07570 [Campylobacter jejuni]|nr:hypothetical protein THJ066_07570 [Campylobacter jejuni]